MGAVIADMFSLSEDDRIKLIGETAMLRGQLSFIVDHDRQELGKANRYVNKLRKNFPLLCEVAREEDCPVKNVTMVHIALADS